MLDDMVEHLGPAYFAPADYAAIVGTVCNYTAHKSASLRQASSYGIGVIAQHGGDAFVPHAEKCLTALHSAIDY